MKLISWNVNGIRSCAEKGLFDFINNCGADAIALQETKAWETQLDDSFHPEGWKVWWAQAQKKGYSGVAIYSRIEPKQVEFLGVDEFDAEGRFLALDFGNLIFAGAYFPNSQEAGARLNYKLGFCRAVQDWSQKKLSLGKQIVLCGDYNIAHEPIDLKNPKTNEGNPGYLPEERAWMSQFLKDGWTDSFRHLYPETQAFSWWSYRFHAREKNIGWRIDYHCVTSGLKDKIQEAQILPQVTGSDHVPVTITLSV